jgi:hypothetical protein
VRASPSAGLQKVSPAGSIATTAPRSGKKASVRPQRVQPTLSKNSSCSQTQEKSFMG